MIALECANNRCFFCDEKEKRNNLIYFFSTLKEQTELFVALQFGNAPPSCMPFVSEED